MTKHYKVMIALVLFLTALVPVAACAATAPPKVVFYGDGFTYGWTTLANTPNWINKGHPPSIHPGLWIRR
jgi:hypothetical protein